MIFSFIKICIKSNLFFYFFRNDTWEALRLFFRSGSLDFVVDCGEVLLLFLLLVLLLMLLFLPRLVSADFLVDVLVVGDPDDDNIDELVAVLVGIREFVAAVCRLFVFVVTLRLLLSLSNLRLTGMGDDRSETLRRFGSGVTLGDSDSLLFGDFVTVGVNFFNCSIR